MRSIMISVKPEWCEKICNYKKTIEIRKTMPKCALPIKVYIYCTGARKYFFHNGIGETLDDLYRLPKNADYDGGKIKFGYSGELMCCGAEYDKNNFLNGKVIAEFVLKKVDFIKMPKNISKEFQQKTCLKSNQILDYLGGNLFKNFYAWHIDDLKIYDEPKNIKMFKKPCISPQMPYCPNCKVGCECISESEQECYRAFGECSTEWVCLNYMDRPPQSWCYVEELREWL